jgi:cobalt/nickel transport protein
MTKFQKRLWIGLLVMALLSPLGIVLPARFNAGGAWGEWASEELQKLIGYVPDGLKRLSDLWKAPLPDYHPGGNASIISQSIWYILSGLLGILVVGVAVYAIMKLVIKHGK